MLTKRILRALLPVALLPLAACATGGSEATPSAEEVVVQVENNIRPYRDVTVRILTPSGLRQLLGSATPGRTTALRYRGNIVQDNYRLVAQVQEGEEITSQPFIMFPGARVVWTLPQNGLTVYPPEEEGGER
ncbi:MAG: hypothetical protein JSV86_02930 [Gemmatimonadota bacterium]|nr:MAG: hypothetical protein JSV86_02930 [Gemmatimonadota bacterium]